MTERNFQIGGGPFQPPASIDLDALRVEVNDLTGQLNDSKAETERLRRRLAEAVKRESIETPDDLSRLLGYVFSEYDPTVFVDAEDDQLTVRIPGLTINDDGEIRPIKREFEVSAQISFEVTAQIEAADEDAAREIFQEALDDELLSLEVNIEPYEGVESSYTTDADIGRVDVREF